MCPLVTLVYVVLIVTDNSAIVYTVCVSTILVCTILVLAYTIWSGIVAYYSLSASFLLLSMLSLELELSLLLSVAPVYWMTRPLLWAGQ